jgi:hypothetical protein
MELILILPEGNSVAQVGISDHVLHTNYYLNGGQLIISLPFLTMSTGIWSDEVSASTEKGFNAINLLFLASSASDINSR